VLTIAVPCYNEEQFLPESAERLISIITELVHQEAIDAESSIYFIDDGSSDATWKIIETLATADSRCHGIKLSRNYGHQNALLAALMSVAGDAVITVDADLQDDVDAIYQMIDAYAAGADIVYGVRQGRESDTFFKRFSAQSYYRLLRWMGVNVIFNHADYRLMSRCTLEALKEYGEANLFLRALVPQLGFNTATVYYNRQKRFAGTSKYPFRRMFSLAVDGITSFSAVPLKMITLLGLLLSMLSIGLGAWAVWVKVFNPAAVPGWASTVIPIYLLGGIQLLCTGIIGQYLAKVYLETKRRPRFIVEKVL
jgi:glycosyltransferase involved in cell wall biosynthesis